MFTMFNEAPPIGPCYKGYGKRPKKAPATLGHVDPTHKRGDTGGFLDYYDFRNPKSSGDTLIPDELLEDPITIAVPALRSLEALTAPLGLSRLRFEKLCVWLHLIAAAGYRKDDLGFVPLARWYVCGFMSMSGYEDVRILKRIGMIEPKKGRKMKKEATQYRLTPVYEDARLTPLTLCKELGVRFRMATAEASLRSVGKNPSHLILWRHLQCLSLDEQALAGIQPDPACPKWLEEQARANARRQREGMKSLCDCRADAWGMQADAIRQKRFSFRHDKKTGRVFHNLSNLAKPIRRGAARLNGQPLAEIDLKNSQPFFMANLYPYPEIEEAKRYREIACAGRVYKELARASGCPSMDLGLVKVEFFKIIFGGPYVRPTSKLWEGFKREFPVLACVIEDDFEWSALALKLQSIEARVMIGHVVPTLDAELPGVPFLTIHDSVAIPPEHAEKAKEVILRCCFAETQLRPKVEITLPSRN